MNSTKIIGIISVVSVNIIRCTIVTLLPITLL